MISRTHRFHGYGSLRRVYKEGQSVRGQHMALKYLARPASRPYRAAVVVSRKVSKSAVVRSRIRRRIYEIIRQSLFTPPHHDLVFTVFDDQVAKMEAPKLQKAVEDLLNKAAA